MEAEGNSSSSSSTAANKKLMNVNNEDIISGLYEPLIHHILSFMDMKEVLKTCLLSKRWTNLWRSVRTLKFHENFWTNHWNRCNLGLKKNKSTVANKKLMNMNNEDRISGLHEPLIHHILSFIDMKEVLQTSLLSKRWTNLWRSVRTLKFHEHSWTNRCNHWNGRNPKLKKNRLTKFKFFVDTVLFLRDGSDIDKFDLFFVSAEYADSRLIDRWVTYAKKRQVQVLRLGGVSILSLETLYFSSRVKTLELFGILLPSNSHRDLVLDLPIVESVIIEYCGHIRVKRLAISGPKLKYLQLENIYEGYNYNTLIKISHTGFDHSNALAIPTKTIPWRIFQL
ncbi:hypothetical protein IFM89_026450 [Coptis chinensis]|uniref:F-box domain-containing protein n=1 Tax=Coptis chinensis TaxID=261450 RepID=A0A835IF38_9MAGN|nr:hypothetical protein IFM89_026450 [Coptis chinensis]